MQYNKPILTIGRPVRMPSLPGSSPLCISAVG